MTTETEVLVLRFVYRNAQDEVKHVNLLGWQERGYYLQGRCMEDGRWKTYRIDRIQRYLDGAERHLERPFQLPPPVLPRLEVGSRPPSTGAMEVCFTGFDEQHRGELEELARGAGLKVVKSVTRNLRFLVGGANAGPKKVEDARAQDVYILNEDQFLSLVETGELPDEQDHRFGSRTFTQQIDPVKYFAHWHFKIGPHHWPTFGVEQREFTRTRSDGTSERYMAWSIDSVSGYSFAAGDMFYPQGTDREAYLQVAYNTEEGEVEVHHGHFDNLFKRKGYMAGYEQLAFWLETGRKPTTLREVFRGNSKAGLLAWQLGDGGRDES